MTGGVFTLNSRHSEGLRHWYRGHPQGIHIYREAPFKGAPTGHATTNDNGPRHSVVRRGERVHHGFGHGQVEGYFECVRRADFEFALTEQDSAKDAANGAACVGSLLMDRLLVADELYLEPADMKPSGL